MSPQERRHLQRFRLRVPLRFRPTGLGANSTEHFTEVVNLSRGGFFFMTSAPLQVGMPIEVTLKMPMEVTGTQPEEIHCRARVVHAKPDAFSDGRMGFGAEIESFIDPVKPKIPRPELVKAPPTSAKLKP